MCVGSVICGVELGSVDGMLVGGLRSCLEEPTWIVGRSTKQPSDNRHIRLECKRTIARSVAGEHHPPDPAPNPRFGWERLESVLSKIVFAPCLFGRVLPFLHFFFVIMFEMQFVFERNK